MSSPAVAMGSGGSDSVVDVRWEDQQKINSFAKCNHEYRELRTELEDLQKQRQKLEDAGDELLMAEDEEKVMVLVGEVFMHKTPDEVTEVLEEKKAAADVGIERLNGEITKLKNTMRDLKAHLYARFGTSINLEHDDEKE